MLELNNDDMTGAVTERLTAAMRVAGSIRKKQIYGLRVLVPGLAVICNC